MPCRALQSPPQKGGVVSFGPFEADLQEGVLRKHGVKVRLQTQPFQVLAALLEKPGALVTRDELRRRLWQGETYVDFEHGLNATVARLRQALGDSAAHPRYVQTVAKRGYRFTAKVEGPATEIPEERPSGIVSPAKHRAMPWIVATVLLCIWAVTLRFGSSHVTLPVLQPAPLTAFRGMEVNPALSPDENQVAFSWNGEKQDNFDIYVMSISSRATFRLTKHPAPEISPCWSPDGRTIAFLRKQADGRSELMLVASSGGPEHRLAEIREQPWFAPRKSSALAWSPDGLWIAAPHREPGDASESIYLFSLTGEKRRLTDPPSGIRGDNMPSFAPDGRAITFCRIPGGFVSEIYVLSLGSSFRPEGQVRRLTDDKRWSAQPVWSRNGRRILYVFGDDASKGREIRVINVGSPQTPPRTMPLNDEVSEIAVGKRLLYSRQTEDTNIWRAKLPDNGNAPVRAELFITSTRVDQTPKYSPDGRKIAFISSRSGPREVWIADADGSNHAPLTSFGGPMVGHPNWSPDGQWIVFHARPEGPLDLFVIPAAGGRPNRLTTNNWEDHFPSYSRDGRSILFSSRRSGELQIWRMATDGSGAVQITTPGPSHNPVESPDGKAVFYHLMQDPGEIWTVPLHGGKAMKVAGPTQKFPVGFTVTSKGIYYGAPPHVGEQRFIRFFSFSTGQDSPVVLARRPFHTGMSVSPDSRYILYDQYDESGSDLMVVENFRYE
jgi:Tol biopolymer transport system component/DNA-binding winged helix-turn-helix (wHTH) protein